MNEWAGRVADAVNPQAFTRGWIDSLLVGVTRGHSGQLRPHYHPAGRNDDGIDETSVKLTEVSCGRHRAARFGIAPLGG